MKLEDGHMVFVVEVLAETDTVYCHIWVHKWCNGVKGSMLKQSSLSLCRGCTYQQTCEDGTSVEFGDESGVGG